MFVEDVRKERKLSIDLEDEINDYIAWCNRCYDDEYVSGVMKFIDDMVEWFEGQFDESLIGFKMGIYGLPDYNNMLDVESFISSYKVNYLKRPMYDTGKKFNLVKDGSHEFSLTSDGIVRDHANEQFELYDKDGNLHKFNNVPVEDLVDWLEDEDFEVHKDIYALYEEIEKYKCDSIFKNGLLDTVMYKLIERGAEYGTVRGYLFARKFNRDASISLSYGLLNLDEDDIKKILIEDYLVNVGDINIECYQGFFNKDKKFVRIYTEELVDVIRDLNMNSIEGSIFYDIINHLLQETDELSRKKNLNK